jgi:hypothetical protein
LTACYIQLRRENALFVLSQTADLNALVRHVQRIGNQNPVVAVNNLAMFVDMNRHFDAESPNTLGEVGEFAIAQTWQ